MVYKSLQGEVENWRGGRLVGGKKGVVKNKIRKILTSYLYQYILDITMRRGESILNVDSGVWIPVSIERNPR